MLLIAPSILASAAGVCGWMCGGNGSGGDAPDRSRGKEAGMLRLVTTECVLGEELVKIVF